MSCLLTRPVAWDGSAAGGTIRPPRSARVRFRHSTNSAARLPPAFKRSAIRLQRHLPRVPFIVVFSDRKIAARCPDVPRDQVKPTIVRLSRFYTKFCLQGDRSTTYAERAADSRTSQRYFVGQGFVTAAHALLRRRISSPIISRISLCPLRRGRIVSGRALLPAIILRFLAGWSRWHENSEGRLHFAGEPRVSRPRGPEEPIASSWRPGHALTRPKQSGSAKEE